MLFKDQIGFENARRRIALYTFQWMDKLDCLRQFKPTNKYEMILQTQMIMEEEYEHGNTKSTSQNS